MDAWIHFLDDGQVPAKSDIKILPQERQGAPDLGQRQLVNYVTVLASTKCHDVFFLHGLDPICFLTNRTDSESIKYKVTCKAATAGGGFVCIVREFRFLHRTNATS